MLEKEDRGVRLARRRALERLAQGEPEAQGKPLEVHAAPAFDLSAVAAVAATLRCPFCHASVTPGKEKLATCEPCGAVHHHECWLEAGSCAACRAASSREATRRRRLRRRLGLAAGLLVVAGALAGLAGLQGNFRRGRAPGRGHGHTVQGSPALREEPSRTIARVARLTADERLDAARILGVRRDRTSAIGRAEAALAAVEADDRPATLEALADAHRLAGRDAVAWCRIGEVETASGDRDVASRAFDYALALDPFLSRAYAGRARVRLETEGSDAAERELIRAFECPPVSATVFDVRARIRLERGRDLEGARADVTTALERDPGSRDARRTLALALARVGQLEEALAWARSAVGSPAWSADLELLATLEALTGQHAIAVASFADAMTRAGDVLPRRSLAGLELRPEVARAHVAACLARGRELEASSPRKALAAYSRAIELAPQNEFATWTSIDDEARARRVVLNEGLGKHVEAEQDLELLRGIHQEPVLELVRARACARHGDFRGERSALRRVLGFADAGARFALEARIAALDAMYAEWVLERQRRGLAAPRLDPDGPTGSPDSPRPPGRPEGGPEDWPPSPHLPRFHPDEGRNKDHTRSRGDE